MSTVYFSSSFFFFYNFVCLLITCLIITASYHVHLLASHLAITASFRVRLLIILLIITASCSFETMMPILTCSQTKAILESSDASNVSYCPSTAQYIQVSSFTNHPPNFYEEPPDELDMMENASLVSMDELFQNSSTSPTEFEISKTVVFENLKQLTVDTTSLSHNSSISSFATMEADCTDNSASSKTMKQELVDITQLFTALSHQIAQIASQNSDIQDKIRENETSFFTKFQEIIQDNVSFKTSIRNEIDELRCLLQAQKTSLLGTSSAQMSPVLSTAPSVTPVLNTSTTLEVPSNVQAVSVTSSSVSTLDNQSQALQLIADSLSKLSMVVTSDKTNDTKMEWPKFSGNAKKFRTWHSTIVAQPAVTPWKELYSATNFVVTTTSNTVLNEKLYSKLLLALEDSVLQTIISRKHLCGDGL
jgi:hypothetical protein